MCWISVSHASNKGAAQWKVINVMRPTRWIIWEWQLKNQEDIHEEIRIYIYILFLNISEYFNLNVNV